MAIAFDFRVQIRVHVPIVSDMIQCSVTWGDVTKNSFMLTHDSHSQMTQEYIESQAHLKI